MVGAEEAATPPSKLPAAVEAVEAEQGGGSEARALPVLGAGATSALPVPPTTPLLPILRPHQTHAVKEAVEERGLVDGGRRPSTRRREYKTEVQDRGRRASRRQRQTRPSRLPSALS